MELDGFVDKAVEFYQKALNIAQEVGGRAGEGRTYSNLGSAYNCLGEFDKAAEFQQKYERRMK